MQETTTYRVDGMTCDHCKAAVTTSVEALPGVEKAEVDLQTGRLTITGEHIDDHSVRAAVADAGYEIAA